MKTFTCVDPQSGVDVARGLTLFENVISDSFETELIAFVKNLCEKGRRKEIGPPTYLRAVGGKRSRGNRREAICYGGFFDFNRKRPGKRGMVPPFPSILNRLTEHLVSKGFLPASVRPDSCIINRYMPGDCIPPHVDHESYARPISTLSLLGDESMLIGTRFRVVKDSTWKPIQGISVKLPRRSLLVLDNNSANVAKHCKFY